MSLLKNDFIEEENLKNRLIVIKEDKEISFKKSLVLSTILHPVTAVVVWLTIVLLTLLGINFDIFKRPEPQQRDIEFVLVNKSAEPINKKTPNRSDRNSRAGGKHNPKLAQRQPEPSLKSTKSSKSEIEQKKGSQRKLTTPAVKKNLTIRDRIENQKDLLKKTQAPKSRDTKVKNAQQNEKQTVPKVTQSSNTKAPSVAVPKVIAPSGLNQGPIKSMKNGASSGSLSSSSTSRSSIPSPVIAPSSSGSHSSRNSRSAQGSRGTSGSRGSAGNPSPGNPKGAPGIDAIKEPDFGAYMSELQRRIKANWTPPRGNQSKRVVLMFTIAKDGRLLSLKTSRSSGSKLDDDAAIAAVKLTAPFRPLPPEYRGSSVDIQFTFDFNTIETRRY